MGYQGNDDYIEVNLRVLRFYEKHPEGRIVSDPGVVHLVADKVFVGKVCRVYLTPDDPQPSQGESWEPFPGKTSFTRDSELENAETSAIGRALAAAGIEVKRSMASANEVRARQADREAPPNMADIEARAPHEPLDKDKRTKSRKAEAGNDGRWTDQPTGTLPAVEVMAELVKAFNEANMLDKPERMKFASDTIGRPIESAMDMTEDEVRQVTAALSTWLTPDPA